MPPLIRVSLNVHCSVWAMAKGGSKSKAYRRPPSLGGVGRWSNPGAGIVRSGKPDSVKMGFHSAKDRVVSTIQKFCPDLIEIEMDFSKFIQQDSLEGLPPHQPQMGFSIHESIGHFNKSFMMRGSELLGEFIQEHAHTKKWILASDYAFYDDNKFSDAVTFSLFPHWAHIEKMTSHISAIAPSDLKNVGSVGDSFISFLKEGKAFSITLILDRERRMFSDEKFYHLSRFESQIGMLEYWCKSTPKGKDRYQATIKQLNKVKQLVNSNSLNLRLLRDIEIVGSLAAYLLTEISVKAKPEKIAWLSDRDSMLTFKKKVIGDFMFDQVSYLYHTLCSNSEIDPSNRLVLIKPETSGKLFYDSLIRVPDYMAGTMADYDFEKQISSHAKFDKIRDGVFAVERRNIFYRLFFHPNMRAHRLTWGVAESETLEC